VFFLDTWSKEYNDDVLVLPEYEALNDIEGGITHSEGLRLSLLASLVPKDLPIVEIGCFRGRSTCFLGAGSRAGNKVTVFAVDPWDLRPKYPAATKPYYDKSNKIMFDKNIKQIGLTGLVKAIKNYSVEAAKTWKGHIGLLHIDGDHSYQGVSEDYEAWSGFVALGGVIAFHDYNLVPVKKFVEEIAKPSYLWSNWTLHNRLMTAVRK